MLGQLNALVAAVTPGRSPRFDLRLRFGLRLGGLATGRGLEGHLLPRREDGKGAKERRGGTGGERETRYQSAFESTANGSQSEPQ